MTDEIHIDTKAALYRKRWEDEQAYSLDLAHQVDQLRAQNAELVAMYNAAAEELQLLREASDTMLGLEPRAADPKKIAAAHVTAEAKKAGTPN
ncbi:MAG: hypothetical protein ACTHJ3_07745 [Pararhizobium sp.]